MAIVCDNLEDTSNNEEKQGQSVTMMGKQGQSVTMRGKQAQSVIMRGNKPSQSQ